MTGPVGNGDKSLGEIVSDVSEKASLLVREEIELAKAEVISKVKTLGKGAGVGAAAGVFLFFGFIMFLFALSFFWNDLFNWEADVWPGFLLTTGIFVVLGSIAGFLAYRWLSTGAPTPDMAIEEAKLTRKTFEHQGIERDQLERSLEREKETS